MIKFYDLEKINAQYAEELKMAAEKVIDSGWYIQGHRVEMFENSVKSYLGVKHAIGCGNGLDALKLIFRGYKEMGVMSDGDEVILPGNTFIATALAVTENNLKPVFVDPCFDYLLGFSEVEKAITLFTKAIIVVHLYGTPCWNDLFVKLAAKHNLKIIEDNAQAFGAFIDNWRHTGNLGHASAQSFYPTKPLGCLGDGGMVTTSDDELASVVRRLLNYGSSGKYYNPLRGINSRLDEIQAAFLSVKMRHLQEEFFYRQSVANRYLSGIRHLAITLPRRSSESAWHLFVIRTRYRNSLKSYLEVNGIETMIHYPIPIHKQTAFKEYSNMYLPNTEEFSEQVLSLPISSVITEEEVDMIIETINRWKP